MKSTTLFTLFFLLFLSSTLAAFSKARSDKLIASISKTPLGKGRNLREIKGVINNLLKKRLKNCKPNVCFALDGSASISKAEYRLQTNFAQVVISVLGGLSGSKFSAVQYGAIVDPIAVLSPGLLGGNGVLSKLRSNKLGKSPLTFVAPGLQWCMSMGFDGAKGKKKIVLIGDGRSTFGPDFGRFGAEAAAEKFVKESSNNGICGVLVGGNAVRKILFRKIVGKSSLVEIAMWKSIGSALRKVVTDTCA